MVPSSTSTRTKPPLFLRTSRHTRNPLRIAFGRPHEADPRAALKDLPVRERLGVVGEILSFMRIYAKFKWGRQMITQAVHRLRRGEYEQSRWL